MSQLSKIFSIAGIHITREQELLFLKHIELILKWNQRTNLISRKDESRIVENHLLESLACFLAVQFAPNYQILDIGSGAGFPAIPLAIMCPSARFILVESKRMKALFLKELAFQLKLKNIEVIGDRIEHLAQHENYHEKFDVVTSRAVSSLMVVYEWAEQLIRPGGYYLAWKGGDIQSEVEQLLASRSGIAVKIMPMSDRLINPDKKKIFVIVNKNLGP